MANPAELRANHQEQAEQEAVATQEKARNVARLMIADMASGADFTYEDFLFAATAGKPSEYPWEERILKRASGLSPGAIVGITDHEKLPMLGQLATDPFAMTVELDPDNPERRILTASLNFAFTVTTPQSRYWGAAVEHKVTDNPQSVPILTSRNEHPARSGYAFGHFPHSKPEHPHVDLLVGARAIIDHANHPFDNPGRRQRIDMLFDHLAVLATKSEVEA